MLLNHTRMQSFKLFIVVLVELYTSAPTMKHDIDVHQAMMFVQENQQLTNNSVNICVL